MIKKLLNHVQEQAPYLMGLFNQIIPIETDADIPTQRKHKLCRILKENLFLKRFQIIILWLIQPILWIFRHKLRTLNLTTFFFFMYYLIIACNYNYDNSKDKYVRCGTVIDMKKTLKELDNYMWVRYDNKEVVKHKVDDQTYYDSKISQRICFDFYKPDTDNKGGFYGMTTFIFFVVWLIGALIFLDSVSE
jgi:hypothetical protein